MRIFRVHSMTSDSFFDFVNWWQAGTASRDVPTIVVGTHALYVTYHLSASQLDLPDTGRVLIEKYPQLKLQSGVVDTSTCCGWRVRRVECMT